MKIFQLAQQYFEVLGIRSQHSRCNLKSLAVWIRFIAASISSCLFLLVEAQNFVEFALAMYNFITYTIVGLCGVILIWKSKKLFKFISNFENFILKSEYHLNIRSIDFIDTFRNPI